MIDTLVVLTPNPARADRTIARCHARLERRAKSQLLERAVVAGVCVMYLIAMVTDVLRIYQ